MPDYDSDIVKKINEAIAAEVVVKLDGPLKDSLLSRAVAEVIKSSGFRYEMEKLVAKRAGELAAAELATGVLDAAITEAFRGGMSLVISSLPAAVAATLVAAFCGKAGDASYDRTHGMMLGPLKAAVAAATAAEEKEKEKAKPGG